MVDHLAGRPSGDVASRYGWASCDLLDRAKSLDLGRPERASCDRGVVRIWGLVRRSSFAVAAAHGGGRSTFREAHESAVVGRPFEVAAVRLSGAAAAVAGGPSTYEAGQRSLVDRAGHGVAFGAAVGRPGE